MERLWRVAKSPTISRPNGRSCGRKKSRWPQLRQSFWGFRSRGNPFARSAFSRSRAPNLDFDPNGRAMGGHSHYPITSVVGFRSHFGSSFNSSG